MGDKTGISWTQSEDGGMGATWNPIRALDLTSKGMAAWGCMKITAGCDNCYASTMHANHGGKPYEQEDPKKYAELLASLQLHEPTLSQPLRWQRGRKIFVCSMTDLFGEWIPDEWIDRVFVVMGWSRAHIFQVLTKRAKRMRDYFNAPGLYGRWLIAAEAMRVQRLELRALPVQDWPLRNAWLGVTVENQETAYRLNYLTETPAAVRWVSAEPLLGPVDLNLLVRARQFDLFGADAQRRQEINEIHTRMVGSPIQWVVIGGESGAGFREMGLDWARSLRDQCAAAGVAVWYKQGSAFKPGQQTELDGRIHHEFPEVAA